MLNLTSSLIQFYNADGFIPAIPPFYAYSVRKLVPTYTGPQLQLKRTSNATLANLYLDQQAKVVMLELLLLNTSLNLTDPNDIADWINLDSSVRVSKIYDQSGNNLHLQPCSPTNMPTLILESSENGLPIVQFNSNVGMIARWMGTYGSSQSAFLVADFFSNGAYLGITDSNYAGIAKRIDAKSKLRYFSQNVAYS